MSTAEVMADVTREDFSRLVLEQSGKIPVLVDFWAAWCGPCQTLMPLLAKLAGEYQGRFFLAKVNSDEQQQLSSQYGVRSLPTVKLFRNGQVVDEFMGAQPESAIRQFLDKHLPRPSDADLQQALALEEQGQREQALVQLAAVMDADPANEAAGLHYVRMLLASGNARDADAVLHALPASARQTPQGETLRAQLDFACIVDDAPDAEALLTLLQGDAGNSLARYQLAAWQVLTGKHEDALENFLLIVQRDRQFQEDAGRKTMLTLFKLLGNDHPLTTKFRIRLASALN